MFFRRVRPKEPTFEERLETLKQAGFAVEPRGDGRVRVSRNGCAALIDNTRVVEHPGLLIEGAIAALVDGGYQKFFRTPDGHKKPALAAELRAVHDFQEDLREALGLTSLYNESLGTVSDLYLYDRLKDRDRGGPKRPWE